MSDPFRDQLQAALAPTYELGRELAGGGMSRVFVATERALGRTVVVKVLSPELSAGVNRDRFRREMQLAAQLQHPHIVPLLSAGEHGALLYYTMPYVEGESVRVRLAARGRLSVREVVRLLHDVVDALAYAHRRGVIHRDIKPGNILTHGAHALVTDFGVAKALSAAMPRSGTTSVGMAMGTPAYMAPEQLAADPAADHRVDLYAAGLVAYELLTGGSPFTSPSPRETMAAQLTRMPEPLHECNPEVPPALSAVIMRCLEKSPEARHESADALLAALEAATLGALATASPGETSGGLAWSDVAAATTPAAPPTSHPGAPPAGLATPASGAAAPAPASAGAAGAAAGGASGARGGGSRRWLVAGALLTAGILAGVGLAARWQADRVDGRDAGAAGAAGAPIAAGDDRRAIVVPVAPPAAQPAAAPPPTAPQALTFADSLAIAAAVRERVEAAHPAPEPEAARRLIDSLSRELQRVLADSIAVALREAQRLDRRDGGRQAGPAPWGLSPGDAQRLRDLAREGAGRAVTVRVLPGGGTVVGGVGGGDAGPAAAERASRRRVLLVDVRNASGRPELAGVATALGRALHGRLEAERAYDVRRLGDASAGGGAAAVGERVGAGAVVAPTLLPPRGDSVVVQVVVTDLLRGRTVGTIEVAAPGSRPLAGLERLTDALRGALGGLPWPRVARPGAPAPPAVEPPPAPGPPAPPA